MVLVDYNCCINNFLGVLCLIDYRNIGFEIYKLTVCFKAENRASGLRSLNTSSILKQLKVNCFLDLTDIQE